MTALRIRRLATTSLCAASLGILSVLAVPMADAQGLTPPGTPPPPPLPSPGPEEALSQMGIVGYADHMSAQPGDTVKFMVSSKAPQYRVDMVRLIHGDANLRGPGVKEEVLSTSVNRDYPGKKQVLPLGSYITVASAPPLQLTGSFTITAWIAPTVHNQWTTMATPKVQGIVAKWAPGTNSGYGLFLDEGKLTLWIGGPGGRVDRVTVDPPLRPWTSSITGTGGARPRPMQVPTHGWYFVAASFDAATGQVRLVQEPVSPFPFDPTKVTVTRTVSARGVASTTAPLLIAAAWSEGSPAAVTGHYNGKIDGPKVWNRALSATEIAAVQTGKPPAGAVGAWDFSRNMASSRIVDTSASKADGTAVNFPTRAVTGHNWTGKEMDFRHARSEYNAIYFHDDDLEDAKWDVGFEFTLPANLRSGVYAARLRTADAEDYVPFFVRPKKGTATAKIAFLVPTFSYLAYGGTGGGEGTRPGASAGGPRLMSLYSHHTDGSGFTYSSRMRPITNIRPKLATRNPWQFMADTHLLDWLETKGFAFDIITDHDLHAEGAALLSPYKAVLTGTHPEYTSPQMHEGLSTWLSKGGRLMYMGGNGFYWVTIPDPTGRYVEVRRRDGTEAWQGAPGESNHSLTGEPGGLWRFRGHAPQELTGVGFTAQGFDYNSPFKRTEGSYDPRAAFIFDGIGRDEIIGDFPSLVLERGAGGSELDRVDYALGSPPHTLILAQSYGHSDAYQQVVEEVNTSDSRQGGTVNPLVHAHLSYFEHPNGGAVFSTGSIAWCGSLSYNNYTNNVSKITENVLRRFASDVPLPPPPAGAAGRMTASNRP
jgi:N,N-dimethylformamidase